MSAVPEVILVTVDRVDPPNPKVNEEVSFTVTAHFSGRARYNTRLEMVMALPPKIGGRWEPCSEQYIYERRTFTAPAYANKYTTVWKLRFGSPGEVKVCFGARILGIR